MLLRHTRCLPRIMLAVATTESPLPLLPCLGRRHDCHTIAPLLLAKAIMIQVRRPVRRPHRFLRGPVAVAIVSRSQPLQPPSPSCRSRRRVTAAAAVTVTAVTLLLLLQQSG